MKQTRGLGFVYQPVYVDKRTGERKTAATWWVQYSVRGKRFRESSGSSNRADAVKLLKRRIGDGAQGRTFGPQAEKTKFRQLTQMLIDDYRANARRSLKRIKASVGHLLAFFGDEFAMDMTGDRIASYVAYRQDEKAAPATINRELAALKRAFRLGEKVGKVIQRPEVSMLREDNRRKGFFEVEEYRAVVENLSVELKPVIQTAYITGWRIASEILTRQKHHVNLDAGWLRLEPGETKNGEGRNFPLTPDLREILTRQIEQTRQLEEATGRIIPWLFHRDGSPIKDFRGTWAAACKGAGVPGRIPHDFRRTAVRNLERAGVPRSAAMAMVGHRTESIYRRYAIADEAMLKEGAVKLAAFHAAEANGPRKVLPLKKRSKAIAEDKR
ncbi:MAG: tyrosine-type recombinase/integrase [Candidatus Binataceae bacterium]